MSQEPLTQHVYSNETADEDSSQDLQYDPPGADFYPSPPTMTGPMTCFQFDMYLKSFLCYDSYALLLIGIAIFCRCDHIPSLPWYVFTFGSLWLAKAVIHWTFKIPKSFDKSEHEVKVLRFINLLQVLIVPISLWGAILTWGSWGHFSHPHCSKALYLAGFLTSAAALGCGFGFVFFGSIFYFFCVYLKNHKGGAFNAKDNSGVSVDLYDNGNRSMVQTKAEMDYDDVDDDDTRYQAI